MATESVAIRPDMYGAAPVKGNFTGDAGEHLWCAQALACVVASPEAIGAFNSDIQEALRHLLHCEVKRADKAQKAESDELREERRAARCKLAEKA